MVERYSKNQKLLVFISYLALYFGLQIVILGYYSYELTLKGIEITPENLIVPGINTTFISAVVSFLVITFIARKRLASGTTKLFTKFRYISLAIGGFALMYIANIGLTVLYNALGIVGSSVNQDALELMISINPVIMALPIAILIPVVEEIVFRGVLLEYFERRIGVIGGVIISSALFGLIHVSDAASLVFFPIYFALGLILALIYVKSNKNILVPIIAHVLNNGIAVLALLIMNGGL